MSPSNGMEAPRRILLWTGSFWPNIGGADLMAARLALSLQRRSHAVQVVTGRSDPALPSEDAFGGIPVHRFDFWEGLNSRSLERFAELRARVGALKRDFRPDIVHVTFLSPDVIFHLETARVRPVPFLVTVQQAAIQGWGNRPDTVVGRLLRAADWITYCSLAMRRDMERVIPELASRGSIVPNALDPPERPPAPPPEPPRILCLGRLVTDKGFDVAVRAFARVVARRPEARLIVAGEGPARPELESLVRGLGLEAAVDFTGWVAPSQVSSLIEQSSLLLVPSRREAFGLVALEAMVAGRPVVAADVGGLPEVVAHGRTGLVVPVDDVAAAAEAVIWILDEPGRAAALGMAGRRLAQERFGWKRHVEAYEQLYEQLYRAGKG